MLAGMHLRAGGEDLVHLSHLRPGHASLVWKVRLSAGLLELGANFKLFWSLYSWMSEPAQDQDHR